MQKKDLIEVVSVETGLPKYRAESIVDSVFNQMAAALANGDEIRIHGFGVLSVQNTPAREGVSALNGQPWKSEAGKKVKFKASKTLNDLVA